MCQKLLSDYPDTYVILGSRDKKRGDDAAVDIAKELGTSYDPNRLEVLEIDVSNDASVTTAAAAIKSKYGENSFYGVVNNAGIGFGNSIPDVMQTNVYGPKRVSDAFRSMIHDGGRIVNIASASGPMYVAKIPEEKRAIFLDMSASSWELLVQRIQDETNSPTVDDSYGFSKACLNMYTMLLARDNPTLTVTSCTPGFILTDLTVC